MMKSVTLLCVSARSQRTQGSRVAAATGSLGKYQLDVTAADVTDVVRHIGGWLYDRAKAGWDVAVTVTGDCDVTPLRILGVRTDRATADDDADGSAAPPRALAFAIAADALAGVGEVRDGVLRELKRGMSEVTIWGDGGLDGIGVECVEHVLSSAALAFKTHAMRAAGADEPVAGVETFRRRPAAFIAD